MRDKDLLGQLELKLMGYATRVKDLELEVAILNKVLKEERAQVIKDKKVELTKNTS